MYVFLYGTLKRGQPNHHILLSPENGRAKFICKGKTVERYPLITATKYRVPFLLDQVGVGKNIQGELYEIEDKMLQTLDQLEQYPQIYSRRLELICKEGESYDDGMVSAWIYFFHTFSPSLLNEKFLEWYECEDPDMMPKQLGDEERLEVLRVLRG